MTHHVRHTASSLPRTLGLLAALGASACGNDDTPATEDGSTGTANTSGSTIADGADSTTGDPAATVTFWQDVAPILYEDCVACHRQGSVGPFSLETYEEATTWAAAVTAAVESRTMPPWLVTDDGSCGEFRYSRAMDQASIDLIREWFDQGTPEGEPRDDLMVPELPSLTGATEIQTPEFFPVAQGGDLAEFDEYRCFLIDPQLPADRFLTAYDVVPGNDAIVHHVLVMPVDPDLVLDDGRTNAEAMQELDDESPDRDGWTCYSAAGEGVRESGTPVVWAPGQGVVEFPEGTGLRILANEQLVVQMHYSLPTPEVVGSSDQTTVQLQLEEQVEREGIMALPDPFLNSIFTETPEELPPGESSVEYTWEVSGQEALFFLGASSVDIFGVFPHMHEFGQAIRMEIEDPSGIECAVDVPRWDFGWQLQYFYQQPITLDGDELLRVTCDYNTTGATEPVTPGWGTQNEMCLMGLYLVP